MAQDLHSNVKQSMALDVQAISTDTTTAGNIIDMKGFDSLEFLIFSGTLTDGSYTPLIEHGDDSGLSDAAAVDDAELLPSGTGQEATAAFADTDDDTAKRIGYRGEKRYVRLSLVSASTTSGGTLGAVALQGHPQDTPTAE